MDLGKKRIGLAISDELRVTAQGLETFHRVRIREDLDALARLIRDREVAWIVLGDPKHMNGGASRQQEYTRDFGKRLERLTGVAVDYWDERLTSWEANRILRSSGMSIEKRAKAIDQLSAVLILEGYLDHLQMLHGGGLAEA
jgi:putative holliday junction resolvase